MLWLCLETAMKAAGKAAAMTLSAIYYQHGATICLSGLEALGRIDPESYPSHREKDISMLWHGAIVSDLEKGQMRNSLPDHLVTESR